MLSIVPKLAQLPRGRARLILTLAAALSTASACKSEPEIDPAEFEKMINDKLDTADARVANYKVKDAEKLYNFVLSEKPGDGRALRGLALARLQDNKWAEAQGFAEKATAALPQDADAWNALGIARREQGDHAGSLPAFAKAFEFDPNNGSYGIRHAVALIKTKKAAEAEAILRKVVEVDPETPHLHTELGDSLRMQGKDDAALKSYMKALTMSGSDKRAHAGAAEIYEKRGDITRAVNEWSSYIQKDCCSTFSDEVAKPKLNALQAKEAKEGGTEPTVEGEQAPAADAG